MTPWLLCVAMLAGPAAPQHPTPPATPAATKPGATHEAKPAAAKPAATQPTDAAARILERLNREFPYTSKPETRGAAPASKTATRGAPKGGVPETRRSSRLTLTWRITLTWPAMQ